MNFEKNQYNNYYIEVIYNNKKERLYNELTTNSLTALYSETQIKLIELIEHFNFKIFYISSFSKSDLKIIFNKNTLVNLNNSDVITIKNLLAEDLYFLYENQFCEVLYSIPKLNDKDNYYFDLLLVVNSSFNINLLYNHNFNLINIKNVNPINIVDISYDWVKNIFEQRYIFCNYLPIQDKNYYDDYYDLNSISLSQKNFMKYYNENPKKFELEKYHNVSSSIFYKNLNQNLYVKNLFRLLDMKILSFDKEYVRVKNEFGYRISYLELYNINSSFLANFDELIWSTSIEHKNINIYKFNTEYYTEYYTYCSIRDNFSNQCIINGVLDKKSVKTGFANLSDLQFEDEFLNK